MNEDRNALSGSARERLIVALDVPSAAEALGIVDLLGEAVTAYKVGLQLFTAAGPDVVRELVQRDRSVFLDLKLHEIPHSVAAATRVAAELGVRLLTVHASGGERMLAAAVDAAADAPHLRILALTVVTSLTAADLQQLGIAASPREHSLRLARLARSAGCHGVVTSPREAAPLRSVLGAKALIVTPGVRPAGTSTDDQTRHATPAAAIRAGASHLVVGRPVTRVPQPDAAARAIIAEIAGALAS